jgi:hypothetical protein
MHREGELILFSADEQYDLRLPASIHVRKAAELYANLGTRVYHAVGVQQILAQRESREMTQNEWEARTGGLESRLEVLERAQEQLGVLAAKEIADAKIDHVIRQMDIDGITLGRLHHK